MDGFARLPLTNASLGDEARGRRERTKDRGLGPRTRLKADWLRWDGTNRGISIAPPPPTSFPINKLSPQASPCLSLCSVFLFSPALLLQAVFQTTNTAEQGRDGCEQTAEGGGWGGGGGGLHVTNSLTPRAGRRTRRIKPSRVGLSTFWGVASRPHPRRVITQRQERKIA